VECTGVSLARMSTLEEALELMRANADVPDSTIK
jgi:hypothetical protein